jgi:hypothetical protein
MFNGASPPKLNQGSSARKTAIKIYASKFYG